MKTIKYLVCIAFILSLVQCEKWFEVVDDRPDFARISNHSNIAIFGIVKGCEYTDTIIPDRTDYTFIALPHELVPFAVSYDTREEYMEKNPVIQVFIGNFEASDKDKYKSRVRQQDYFLKRYELTRELLEEHNWIIDYP